MGDKVLVTGGAGFIGSHIVDLLVSQGRDVRVYDSLAPQVHGPSGRPPSYLNPEAEFIRGDVTDRDALAKALRGVRVICHQAAAVGIGQSMYEVRKFVHHNSFGTAVLLDILANDKHRVERLVVASSNTIYGEGEYDCARCGSVWPGLRPTEQLERRDWETRCPKCGDAAKPAPTSETKPLAPSSIYAITKRDQEEMCLAIGRAYGISTVALRYFNVYGPRQALSNPYTGVAAIFSNRLLNGKAPVVYEDGGQTRDFVHVSDVARANALAMESDASDEAFNVGTGRALGIGELASILIDKLGFDGAAEIRGNFRKGDVRHCYADISKINAALGFQPQVTFEQGVAELIEWVKSQEAADTTDRASRELESHGLM